MAWRTNTVTELLMRGCHEKTAHGGGDITLSEIKSIGYWIIDTNSMIKQITFKFVRYRSLRGRLGEQKMTNLPYERTTEAPHFVYCGVEMLGTF